jgi:hypothetical protein
MSPSRAALLTAEQQVADKRLPLFQLAIRSICSELAQPTPPELTKESGELSLRNHRIKPL